jgi:hypothetical protein
MKRILSSRIVSLGATVAAAALLVVGAAAYISSRPDPSPATNTETYGRDFELPETTPVYKASDLPKGVQTIAGEFILAAVGREDLAKAWSLTHPELRAQCGCTYKQWLTGNIPVQYYPSDDIDTASFEVAEITPREIFLRVLLLPKEKSTVKPQVFDIGLKASGKGAKKTWRVNYWNAKVSIPVPATPEG